MFFEESSNLTEAAWLAGDDPYPMIVHLELGMYDRKGRLFFCAACRRLARLTPNPAARAYIEAQEAFADGRLRVDDLLLAQRHLKPVWPAGSIPRETFLALHTDNTLTHLGRHLDNRVLEEIVSGLVDSLDPEWPRSEPLDRAEFAALAAQDLRFLAGVVRCIWGNPWRPAALNPGWRTADVLGLARGIYDDRAFDRLPILHDALIEAGCTSDDVLGHCREEGPHARGCWVVDLVLGQA
jgi:hypothetical protein